MKIGDKVEITGGDYHFFRNGDIVEFTGEFLFGFPRFKNSTGTVQTIREEDFREGDIAVAVVDDDLDDLIGTLSSYTIPTEHRPRDNTNFTLTINEQALNDDIPFIIDAYYKANLSLREVGSLLGVDEATIRRRMKKHGVPTRTVSEALRAKYSL